VTSITGRPDNRAAMQNSTAMADRIHRTLSGQPYISSAIPACPPQNSAQCPTASGVRVSWERDERGPSKAGLPPCAGQAAIGRAAPPTD
jgi:hypothetical protein